MSGRVAIALAGAASLAIYVSRLDAAAGLYVDDAWFVVLARAIAQGDGYLVISSATTPILPTFPPGFPLLLAPLVAMFPEFPANVVVLKAAAIVTMFAIAIGSFVYLHRYRGAPPLVAGTAAVVTLLMPSFVFLATSTIMSEPAFTLSQIALLLVAERTIRSPRPSTTLPVASGVLAAFTLLLRSAGVAAVAAVAWCLWRRQRRAALVFAAVTAACYLPWIAYSATHQSTREERLAHGGGIAYRYEELLTFRVGNEPGSGSMSLLDLPPRIAFNVVNIFGRDVGAQLLPAAYRDASESGQEVFLVSGEGGMRATGMGTGAGLVTLSSLLSVVMLIGFISAWRRGATVAEWAVLATIGMVLLVPVTTFRYVLPLAPFLVFYFFCGVDALAALARRTPVWQFGAPFRVAAMCVLLLFALEHGQYLQAVREGRATWLWSYQDVKQVTDWMNANVPDGAVATSNPGLVWLSTGRKTVAYSNPRTHWKQWQASGIRYAATLHAHPPPPGSVPHRVLHVSSRLKLWVAELRPGLTESDKPH